ncbi:MAG: hypothetical protein NW203_14555 [Hyphomonadaceae bacterium]|nr:hypothetical protein [Hyphomonadaceae bacterium]
MTHTIDAHPWRAAALTALAQVVAFAAASLLAAHALGGLRSLAERLRTPDAFVFWELGLGLVAVVTASLLATAAFDAALRKAPGARRLSGRRAAWFAACALAFGLALAVAFSAWTWSPLQAEALGAAPSMTQGAWIAGFALLHAAAISAAIAMRVLARRPARA